MSMMSVVVRNEDGSHARVSGEVVTVSSGPETLRIEVDGRHALHFLRDRIKWVVLEFDGGDAWTMTPMGGAR